MTHEDIINKALATIRTIESGNNYTAENPYSSASGAYQYVDATWNHYGGYAHAADAPRAVQDAKARSDVTHILSAHNWDPRWVPAEWYSPAIANSGNWNQRPNAPGNPNTVNQYVSKWMGTYNNTQATTPTAASTATGTSIIPSSGGNPDLQLGQGHLTGLEKVLGLTPDQYDAATFAPIFQQYAKLALQYFPASRLKGYSITKQQLLNYAGGRGDADVTTKLARLAAENDLFQQERVNPGLQQTDAQGGTTLAGLTALKPTPGY